MGSIASASSQSSSAPHSPQMVAALVEHFKARVEVKGAQETLTKEFQHLLQEEQQLWANPKNFSTSNHFQHLNRYSNILAIDTTIYPPSSKQDPKYYFNANLLDAKQKYPGFPFNFVAHQAPTQECFGAIWDSVLKSKAMGIVMLTGLVEGGRPKADCYWPVKKGAQMEFGDKYDGLTVTNLGDSEDGQLGVRQTIFRVKSNSSAGNEDFQTVLFRYNDWPDFGVPKSTASIEHLCDEVEKRAKNFVNNNGADVPPLFVHCSAGVGRTGTFIGSMIGKFLFRQGQFNPDSTIYETVRWMKQQRVGSVQRSEQYFFIHRMMLAEMQKKK